MGTLEITIRYDDGQRTVYRGEAEWITDEVEMKLVEGPAVAGYEPGEPMGLEFHAAICRSAVWKLGLDTEEKWESEGFRGGRVR